MYKVIILMFIQLLPSKNMLAYLCKLFQVCL